METGESQPTLAKNASPPSSGQNNKPSKKTARSESQAEFLDPEMGAILSSETPVDFYRITKRYIPENRTLLSPL
jgi:hypothetical protein